MPSPSPLLYDTYYHIYNRGINRENIFVQERNYAHFQNLYIKYIEPVADTFAYCLLRNHFHLLVRIKSESEILEYEKTLKVSTLRQHHAGQNNFASMNISLPSKPLGSLLPSKKFSDFFNAYAKAINNVYGRTGSLFQHPFGRVMITSDVQFFRVIAYIHQNPQKHGFVDDFRNWKYTSYDAFLSGKPTHLQRATVLNWFGNRNEYVNLHTEWVNELQSKEFAGFDYD
jgi:putative transposase